MSEQHGPGGGRPAFFRRRDLLAVAAVLLLAGLVWLAVALGRSPGAVAVASFVRSETAPPVEIDLGRNGLVHMDADLPVTLEVKDGAVRFVQPQCPDHLCAGTGWLRNAGEWAACLPAGVMVRVEEGR